MNWRAGFLVVAGVLMAGFGHAAGLPPAAPVTAVCNAESSLQDFRSVFDHDGQTMAAPITSMLPDDGSAKFLFHQPLNADAGASFFLVYEVWRPRVPQFGAGAPLAIYSVDEAPQVDQSPYQPADSVQIQTGISGRTHSPWQRRYFVIVGCSGGNVTGWALVGARVSNTIWAAWICAVTSLLSYVLWCLAVWNRASHRSVPERVRDRLAFWLASRRMKMQAAYKIVGAERADEADYLAAEYPSIFAQERLTWWQALNPIHLTVNDLGEPSVQKFQVVMFSFLVCALVLFIVLRTGELVNLSDTVVGLLGISTVGAVSAKIAYQQRTRLSFDNWSWLQLYKIINLPQAGDARFGDLVLTNREFDIYKMQTIIFSLVVACALLIAGGSDLSTFTVPDTLLGILGLSQVTYLGGVLVRPPAVGELDEALTNLQAAASACQVATAGAALEKAKLEYVQQAVKIRPMIESTLGVSVDLKNMEKAMDKPSLDGKIPPAA